MSKLYNISKERKVSKKWKRKYTSVDMAIIKHDVAVRNAEIKRGEVEKESNTEIIYECGCGHEGCFIHTTIPNKK